MNGEPPVEIWPHELFGSDTARAVSAAYDSGGGEAVLRDFAPLLDDPIEGPVVVLTLANAQWVDGRLGPDMADAAAAVIEDEMARRPSPGTDGTMWAERRRWLGVLADRFSGNSR